MTIFPLPELVYIPIHDWIEDDPVIVIKQDAAWQVLQPRDLDWDIGVELDAPLTATEHAFERLVDQCDGMGDIVYAIGGRAAVDAAKFVAKDLDLPLISVPTALSSDAFLTATCGVWDDGVVRNIESIPPEIALLDLDMISRAPTGLCAAGIVDVLSIATACVDWKLAEGHGQNPPSERYDAGIADIAQSILRIALACAGAAGQGDFAGLKSLVNGLALEVQLRNLLGHSRAQSGSEHVFAQCAESLASNRALPALQSSAEFVAHGILLMASRQGQDVAPLRHALDAAGVSLTSVPQDLIDAALRELPAYTRKRTQML